MIQATLAPARARGSRRPSRSERDRIEYRGIVASDEYITERGAPQLRIPRSDVEAIDVRLCSPVQHPVLAFVFGLAAVAVGLYPLRRIFEWLRGAPLIDLEVALVGFLVLGVYALYEASQRVRVLVVRTARGARKLSFRGRVRRDELNEFLDRLATDLGYVVHSQLPDAPRG